MTCNHTYIFKRGESFLWSVWIAQNSRPNRKKKHCILTVPVGLRVYFIFCDLLLAPHMRICIVCIFIILYIPTCNFPTHTHTYGFWFC